MGGAFGHLSNVFDVDFSKAKLQDIIRNSLDLKFDTAEIKTDAINLLVSVKNGKVIAARNKGHLKNYGENAMDLKGIENKFAGREVGVAYGRAMKDLQNAIGKLTTKQQDKIFNNGQKWLSIEVIGHGGKNIIDYQGITELRLHGTIEYGPEGTPIAQIDKSGARILDGMLRQRGAEKQSNFTIKKLTAAQFKSIQNVDKKKAELLSQLNSVMGNAKSVNQFKENGVRDAVSKRIGNKALEDKLIARWMHDDKTKITDFYKEFPEKKDLIQELDKDFGSIIKDVMLPMEYLFLKLGSIVVGALDVFMTLNPKATKKDLQRQLSNAIDLINSKGDAKAKAKLALELKRLEAAGGVNAIHPEEGITFFVGDEFVKLTGTFAPLNQILGMLYTL